MIVHHKDPLRLVHHGAHLTTLRRAPQWSKGKPHFSVQEHRTVVGIVLATAITVSRRIAQ
jgi:hypothetical protein